LKLNLMKNNLLITILLYFNISLVIATQDLKEFEARPGFPDTIKLSVDGFSCSFSYACNGGTGEKWKLGMETNKEKNEAACFIGRGIGGAAPPSYLVFTSFSVNLEGASIQHVEMKDNYNLLPEGEQWKQNGNKILPGTKFSGSLYTISVYGQKSKDEL